MHECSSTLVLSSLRISYICIGLITVLTYLFLLLHIYIEDEQTKSTRTSSTLHISMVSRTFSCCSNESLVCKIIRYVEKNCQVIKTKNTLKNIQHFYGEVSDSDMDGGRDSDSDMNGGGDSDSDMDGGGDSDSDMDGGGDSDSDMNGDGDSDGDMDGGGVSDSDMDGGGGILTVT